ncbi:hypothetical protein LXA43DRAFT_745080 [Ganoderma leucocontextum]|nr:hypothetical protein LXA43DRAFT_745080 [Ganoderma leucocontextum]
MRFHHHHKWVLIADLSAIRLKLGMGLPVMINSYGADARDEESVWTRILQGVGPLVSVASRAAVPHVDMASR